MAALPFQPARTVGFRRDEPQRRAVVVRRRDALAARVEHQAGDARRMLDLLEFCPRPVEQVHLLADRAGQQALALLAGEARDVLDPFHAERRDLRRRAVRADAPEAAVVAAADEA